MWKKIVSWMGAIGILAGPVCAASATVWTEKGDGTKAPAYWYVFDYGTGASVDTSTTASNLKVGELTVKAGKTSNGAGFGFTWEQNASYKDVPITLAAYKGVCLTYSATAPFRIDFKQSTITDDNYYGMEMAATSGFKKTFVAFADLKQGWKSQTAVAWNVTKQMGIQFSYKNDHATSTQNTNTIQLASIILDNECVTYAPKLQSPYTTADETTLNEGDTLTYDLTKVFTDPDGDDLTYTVKIVADKAGLVKLVDSLYNKTNVVKFITASNPVGDAAITITATDPTKKTASYTVTVSTVDRENAPVAVDDAYETEEEKPLKVSLLKNSVVQNDYDPDGDSYTPAIVETTTHGKLVFDDESGTFTYTPNENFYGKDYFTYRLVEDPRKNDADYEVKTGNIATVTITVTNVDDPLTVTIADSTIYADDAEYKLGDTLTLNEDFDPIMVKIPQESVVFYDPDVISELKVDAKASGILTVDYGELKNNYVIQLLPIADANGVAKVTLFAVDGKDTASVCFYVKVTPVADPPVAVDDSYNVTQDTTTAIDAKKGVLANDKNPDGKSTLKAYLLADAAEGKVTLAEDGSFTYAAGKDEGTDEFTYYVVNAEGDTSAPATVALKVVYKNKAPTIVKGVLDTVGTRLASLNEDFVITKRYSKLEMQTWFTDDLDEVTKLTFTVRSDDSLLDPSIGTNGILQINSVLNACGDAKVIVTAKDSQGASTDLAIPASIACVNDKPTLRKKGGDTVYVGTKSEWLDTIDLSNSIYDPDGDSLTFSVSTNKFVEKNTEWEVKGHILIVKTKADAKIEAGTMLPYTIKAYDATDSATFIIHIAQREPPVSIAPMIALPKVNWQSAILANRGAVALFDMQGRVMWKAKLPVSEADVRNAAAQVQGRKILQVNKQRWTIK